MVMTCICADLNQLVIVLFLFLQQLAAIENQIKDKYRMVYHP